MATEASAGLEKKGDAEGLTAFVESQATAGVSLRWLCHFHANSCSDPGACVARVFAEELSEKESADIAECADANLLVLVHPSTPWLALLRALLNHMRCDLKQALKAVALSDVARCEV